MVLLKFNYIKIDQKRMQILIKIVNSDEKSLNLQKVYLNRIL